MRPALILLISLLFAACVDEKAMIQKFAPKDDDDVARNFIDLIRQGRYDEVKPMLDRAVQAKADAATLDQLHQVVNHGDPIAVELVGANVNFFKAWDASASKRQTNLTYQLQFHDAWAVAVFAIETDSTGRHISGANFQALPDSLQVLNQFTFKNKPAIHYLFFFASLLIPLFIIATIIVCLRSGVRRRWLWIIFILFGMMQFQLNWTTNQMAFQPISVMLLGASFFRASSYSPVVLSFGIPVGAIIFLIFRRRLRPKGEQPPLPTA
ncbi:MAG: hypothetical protein J2P56_04615, partial [Verrucomicrobia bacterium]|nr:hypothetical protein [Verrucomicrobiota bacterium]